MTILQGLKATYEKHHRVQITDEAVETAVKMAHRYLTSRPCQTLLSTSWMRQRQQCKTNQSM